jgi:nitrate/TMAO reductase-like tetraheme cytochrome c subunit
VPAEAAELCEAVDEVHPVLSSGGFHNALECAYREESCIGCHAMQVNVCAGVSGPPGPTGTRRSATS